MDNTLKHTLLFAAVAMCAALLTSCHHPDIPANSMYYWNRELTLSQPERKFLTDQHVGTVYIHLFDLEPGANGKVAMTNTMTFVDQLPRGLNIVPLVFIKPDLLDKDWDMRKLADVIVGEADHELTSHGYPKPREIQVDCDWGGEENQAAYFRLLEAVGDIMHRRSRGQVSCTVRLYQLGQDTPPADYATLMLYNTGSDRTRDPDNAILSYDAIHQFLDDLMRYEMPLSTVLPLYGWDMVYQYGRFSFVARGLNLQDTACYSQIDPGVYRSKIYRPVSQASDPEHATGRIYPGDIIRKVEPTAGMLDSLASLISDIRPGDQGNIALMRLDSLSVSRFSAKTYRNLFEGGSIRQVRKVLWD